MSDSDILIEGYLYKRSIYIKKWRKRWMVIKNNYLYSYKQAKIYKHPTEILNLNSFYMTLTTTDDNSKLGEFELISLNSSRSFIASSLSEMNKWINNLNYIITKCNIDSSTYLHSTCSNVLSLSNKQSKGMSIYYKLISMGLNNNDICLMAACKYYNNLFKAVQFVIEQLNLDSIILREHFLYKKSKWLCKWRKRWTVLMFEPYGNICFLATYKNRKEYKLPTEVIILNTQIQILNINDKNNKFSIKLNDKKNTCYDFKANNLKLRDEWVSLLVSRKNNWIMLNEVESTDKKTDHYCDKTIYNYC